MAFLSPQVAFPAAAPRRSIRRRRSRLGSFGLAASFSPYTGGIFPGRFPGPRLLPPIRTYCAEWVGAAPAGATWDPVNCRWIRGGILPPATPAATAGTPVPENFPTNQIFVNADGSQWIYSTPQGKWISMGTPVNVGVTPSTPPTPASPGTTAPTTPVSVSVTPAAPAPAVSPYQAVIDFATQSTLAQAFGLNIPNWLVLAGGLLAFKFAEGKFAGGRR